MPSKKGLIIKKKESIIKKRPNKKEKKCVEEV